MSNFQQDRLGDYLEVKDRLEAVRAKYPDGRLTSTWQMVDVGGVAHVVVRAEWKQTADDHPSVGHSWMAIPGRTPYTKGSELENAETSAWGRALVAGLVADTRRSVASADEIRAKDVGEGPPLSEQNPDGRGVVTPPPQTLPRMPSWSDSANVGALHETYHAYGVSKGNDKAAIMETLINLFGSEDVWKWSNDTLTKAWDMLPLPWTQHCLDLVNVAKEQTSE